MYVQTKMQRSFYRRRKKVLFFGILESHNRRIKLRSEEKEKDVNEAVTVFDLQNVITLPKSNISINFYKRKLNCYNLTAYCSANKTTYCGFWH